MNFSLPLLEKSHLLSKQILYSKNNTLFEKKIQSWLLLEMNNYAMCGYRKYPYLPHGWSFYFYPRAPTPLETPV